jgi:hypothetical protein
MTDGRLRRLRDPARLARLMIDVASDDIDARYPTPSPEGKDPAVPMMPQRRRGGSGRKSDKPVTAARRQDH